MKFDGIIYLSSFKVYQSKVSKRIIHMNVIKTYIKFDSLIYIQTY